MQVPYCQFCRPIPRESLETEQSTAHAPNNLILLVGEVVPRRYFSLRRRAANLHKTGQELSNYRA